MKQIKIGSKLLLGLLILFMLCKNDMIVQAADEIPAPTNIRISLEDDRYAVLRFDAPVFEYEGHLEYNIKYDTDGDVSGDYYSDWFTDTKGYLYAFAGEEVVVQVQTVLFDNNGYEIGRSEWSEPHTEIVSFGPVFVNANSAGINKITLKWDQVYEGDGYYIYRSTSKNGKYKKVKDIQEYYTTSWTDTGLTTGKTYYYKMCVYSDYYDMVGELSDPVSAVPKPAKRTLTVKPGSSTSARLKWNASSKDIAGYQIYCSASKDSGFKLIKTIKNYKTTTFTNKNLTNGNTYYYKIRPYAIVNDEKVFGDYSAVKKVKITIGVPDIESITLPGIKKAKITFTKIPDADGYQVYRSTEKDGTYKRIKTTKDKNEVTCTATGLTNGQTYYFKVRAFKKVDGKTLYGAYSDVKKRVMNKVAYAGESYYDKTQRIFGKDYYAEYKTAKAAAKNMKEIKIKTWDINSKGKKYTRYHYLTVHKNIAGTVQEIFKEIYNGDEKFPIHDVGGYSWRGDSSSSTHCEGVAIDINVNENAQFNGSTGKPMVGELYKPGKNPYSIPEDGDVVNAFRKYGFGWGNWFSNPDYMHFSYFNR